MIIHNKVDSYCDIFMLSEDKRLAMQRVLECILVDIKETLVREKINSFEAHGNVLIMFNLEWLRLVGKVNAIQRQQVLSHHGLVKALFKMFPTEMQEICNVNPNVKKLAIAARLV